MNRVFLLLLLLLISSAPLSAADLEDEIGGLVIDRTITRFGKDFYQDFSAKWRTIRGTNQYTLTIIEAPIPQSGTVLWIETQGKRVYQTYFGRRKINNDGQMEEQAIRIVLHYISALVHQEKHPDLHDNGY